MKKYKYSVDSLKYLLNKDRKDFLNSIGNKGRKEIILGYNDNSYTVNKNLESIIESKIHSISFFSGAGGLDIGAQLAGSKIISCLDFDLDSIKTLKENKYFEHSEHFHNDINLIKSSQFSKIIKKNNPEKLIVIGGPPCQPFSKAGYWVTHKNRLGGDDPRNMIDQYLKKIGELKPDGFILENVESLLHPKNEKAVLKLKESIIKLGYNFIVYRADALEFGVPQKRKRVFFIASRKKINGEPIKTHGDVLESHGELKLKPYERVIDWIGHFDKREYFEIEETISGKTYENELFQIPPGKNYFALTERDGHPNPKFIANKRFWNFLLKLHPFQPSWTIAAQPGPWVGPFHWNNRRLRIPEISAIQTFPSDYKFVGNRRSVQRQIGNAVPSILGKKIIEHLISNI